MNPAFLLTITLTLVTTVASAEFDYDPDIGEEINEVCAGCHGEFGQGEYPGEYPRLAGLPEQYLIEQLKLFRARQRPNMAMVEYVDDRQMPDEEIFHISRYLSEIKLKTKLSKIDETAPDFNAYARLLESKKLMQVPRAKGDIKAGKKLYKNECASCHHRSGYGKAKKGIPMLAGQYTSYLWRQVELFRKHLRIHDSDEPEEELLDDFSDEEIQNIFAWLSTVDD